MLYMHVGPHDTGQPALLLVSVIVAINAEMNFAQMDQEYFQNVYTMGITLKKGAGPFKLTMMIELN